MTHPVFGGTTLYAESTVTALEAGADPEVGIVTLAIDGINQDNVTVSKITVRLEIYRQGQHPEDHPDEPPAEEERFRSHHVDAQGALVEQTGLAFEDMKEGETFIHWPGRTITFEESRLHALRSLEINPRWHDEAYLKKHQAMTPAVFEPLVIGFVTALTTRTLGRVVANLGWTGIELPRPVKPGETIYAESTIGPVRASHSRPTQGIAKVETRAFVEDGVLVCRYQRALLSIAVAQALTRRPTTERTQAEATMTKHEDLYRRRLTSPQAALRDLPKRCSVLLGIFSAQPPALVQALSDRAKGGEVDEALVYYMHATPATVEALIRPDMMDVIKLYPFFLGAGERGLVRQLNDHSRKVVHFVPN